jgi:hypothetical protein
MAFENFNPLNLDPLMQALHRTHVFDGGDDVARRSAAIKAAQFRGLDTTARDINEADRKARLIVALAPEHRTKSPAYTPAERLTIYEELVRVDRDAAFALEKEDPNAIKLARAARDQGRRAVENRRRDLNNTAFGIEQRLGDARNLTGTRGALHLAQVRLWEAQQQPPHIGAEKIAAETVRIQQLTAEVANLERQATEARTAATNLTEV